MATLGSLRADLTLETVAFTRGLDRASAALRSQTAQMRRQTQLLERSFAGVQRSVGSLRSGITALAGALAVRQFATFTKGALDAVGGLGEMATAAGVTIRELQILRVAAGQTGVSSEQLQTSLARFGRVVGEIAQGTGAASKTFERYGIATRDASGQTRSSMSILRDFADAVRSAESDQERLRLAQEAFGRGGAVLVNILKDGAVGLDEFARQAEAAGLIISDSLVAQADRASDALTVLQLALTTGFNLGIIESFASTVTSSTDALTKAREAGEAFGNAVGTSMRAVAVAAVFVSDNFKLLAAAAALFVGLKLGAFIGGVVVAMARLVVVLRQGVVVWAALNAIMGKNLFVKLAQLILGAGSALAAWLALSKASASEADEFAGQLAAINQAMEAQTEVASDAADSIGTFLEQARRENEQLSALAAAHRGYGHSVQLVADTIEIDNALRAQKVTRLQAEESGLLEVLRANQLLRQEIDAMADAQTRQARTQEKVQAAVEETSAAQTEAARRTEDLALEPFRNALSSIQSTFTSTFEDIYSGGVTSFGDLADTAKKIFIRLAAELTTLMIFQPQVVGAAAGMSGAAGGASLASQLGGGINSFGGRLGFSAPAASGVGPPTPGFFGSGATLAGTLGAAGLGALGGSIAGSFFGGKGALGGGVGGALGAGAGFAVGGPVGGLIGGVGGSLLGGLLGGIFGKDKESTGALRFSSTAGPGGPFGGTAISGENSFAGPLAQMIKQFDEGVAEFLTTREEKLVGQALQALKQFEGRFPESDPSAGFSAILRQRAETVLKTGFPGISSEAVLEGATGVEDLGRRIEIALQTKKRVEELTQSQTAGARFDRALQDIRDEFEEVTASAKEFGISISSMGRAQERAIKALQEQRNAEIEQLKAERARRAEQKQAALEQLRAERVQREAELLQRQKENSSALRSGSAQFQALRDPLEALRTQINFANLDPAGQFNASQRDFQRISRLAQGGDLSAISQLAGSASLFREQAGRFGASPLQAEVDAKILRTIDSVLGKVNDAQKQAQRDVVGAIKEAAREEVSTLRELIVEVRILQRDVRRRQREDARVA